MPQVFLKTLIYMVLVNCHFLQFCSFETIQPLGVCSITGVCHDTVTLTFSCFSRNIKPFKDKQKMCYTSYKLFSSHLVQRIITHQRPSRHLKWCCSICKMSLKYALDSVFMLSTEKVIFLFRFFISFPHLKKTF